jgi:glucose/mannose-6-phosphate isomerase
MSPVDSAGMLDLAYGLPEQVEAAVEAARGLSGLPEHDRIENVVVLGMGGSGIAGDVAAAVAGPFMPVPVVIQKGYAPPQFVNEHSLVFAVSCSGDTEETVEAATMAGFDGARLVIVSQGGQLADLGGEWGAVHVPVDPAIPWPRAAFGALAIPILCVLDQVGLFPGADGWISEAVDQLRRRRDQLRTSGQAAELAARLAGSVPVFYGGGSIGEVAALRWKNQVNENAKVPAFAGTVPEITHNEICGWDPATAQDRRAFRPVFLRQDAEHPQLQRRFDYLAEVAADAVGGIEHVQAEGEGSLAQLLDLVLVGDVTSIELAYQLGVDPGPVDVLVDLKERLAEPGEDV